MQLAGVNRPVVPAVLGSIRRAAGSIFMRENMPTLIAKERFPYGGSYLKAGDRFEESEKHAEILTALGKADYVTRDTVHVEASDDLSSLREQANLLGVAIDGRWGVQRLREEIAKSGRYQRRDFRAED